MIKWLSLHKINLAWLIPTLLFCIIMVNSMWKVPMWMDEYIFYRLTSNLPNYQTSSNWFYQDRPQVMNPMNTWEKQTGIPYDRNALLDWIYSTKAYGHNMLEPILCYPLVQTVNFLADHNVIPHVEDEMGYPNIPKDITQEDLSKVNLTMNAEAITKILRFVPIILFALSMWLIFLIMYPKVKNNAAVLVVPVAACVQMLGGVYFFYWDVWMMFFFILTYYLMERKSKWAYVTACCLVNTKIFVGLAFLLPLVFKNWRMIFTGFAFAPWYLFVAYKNGNLFYPITHYVTGTGMDAHNYVYHLHDLKGWILMFVMLGVPFFILMTFPIFAKIKKYPDLVALLIISVVYAFGSGLTQTDISDLVYVGALIFPVVSYEFGLLDKTHRALSWI